MRLFQRIGIGIITAGLLLTSFAATAGDVAHSTVGVGGYDVVSYQTGEKPVRGNGNHLTVHEGVTYLFQTKENQKAFDRNPAKYVPAFGGYCAFGVSVGKKFHGDPDVWEVVDGRLYLNLDNKIKGLWMKDVEGNLAKASKTWPGIEHVAAKDL
jgi:YHS domain-containing protein